MTDKLNLNNSGKAPRLPQLNSLPKIPGMGGQKIPSIPALSPSAAKAPGGLASPSAVSSISPLGASSASAASSESMSAASSLAPAPAFDNSPAVSSISPLGASSASAASSESLSAAPSLASAPAFDNSPVASPALEPASAPGIASVSTSGVLPAAPVAIAAPVEAPMPQVEASPEPVPMPEPAPEPVASIEPQSSFDLSDLEDEGPLFGGAATSDIEYDEEEDDDAGEKTQMLGVMEDDEEELDDLGGEKTQITMSAMDFDPLSGKLIVESGKTPQREYILVRDKTKIGRAPKNDIAISERSMSREHAEIDKFPEGFRVRDLDSGNGTVLNGYRIRVGQLRNGDIIEIGGIRFRFEQEGGDPDVLWRGEPKIEYHPNQQKKPPVSSASSAPSTPEPQPEPQMQSLLQRQAGTPPAWASASPMTSPYMMSYGGNSLRNAPTTPTWAYLVLIGLGFFCIVSLIWFLFAFVQSSSATKAVEGKEALIVAINEKVNDSALAYNDLNFTLASEKLKEATELDKEGDLLHDVEFFDFYRKLLAEEDDRNKEISKIRRRKGGKIKEYEQDIQYLLNVPESSVTKRLADSYVKSAQKDLVMVIRSEVRKLANDNNISEARELLGKLSALPDTANDVRNLSRLIADREKLMK